MYNTYSVLCMVLTLGIVTSCVFFLVVHLIDVSGHVGEWVGLQLIWLVCC